MTDTTPAEREYDFTLIVSGVAELTAELEDGLFEAGCDDATLSFRAGTLRVDFTRSASSLEDAVQSAFRDVRRAGFGADLVRIATAENPDLVDEIARAVA